MTGGLDFDRIWGKQALPETVKEVMRAWSVPIYNGIVRSAEGRNVTEWCKKPECWAAVRSLDLRTEADLTRFAAKDGVGVQVRMVDTDDAAAISECLRLMPGDWERLLAGQ